MNVPHGDVGETMRTFIFIALAWAYMSTTWADSPPKKQFAMYVTGVGIESCATYVLALNESRPTAAIKMDGKTYYTDAAAYTQWVVGFVNAVRWVSSSGETYVDGKKVRLLQLTPDVNATALAVKKICENKPEISLYEAVAEYVNTKTEYVNTKTK